MNEFLPKIIDWLMDPKFSDQFVDSVVANLGNLGFVMLGTLKMLIMWGGMLLITTGLAVLLVVPFFFVFKHTNNRRKKLTPKGRNIAFSEYESKGEK